VLLCLALWLPGFFNLPPTDRDESRFAQATKQMVETGDYVRIMNGIVPRNRKPIGIHWLQAPFAAAARATGAATSNPIWPYRIPSLLGGIAAVLATYSLGLTLLADRRAALAASAMLASCVILTVEAHIAKTDAALLGATTLAMAVLARAWRGEKLGAWAAALFWVAAAAGILIKGPITPLVLGATTICASLAGRRWRWTLTLRPGWGAPLLLLLILPWFIAIGLATHGRFFSDAVGGDLGSKLAGGSESHGAPPGLHLLLLPLLAFPATVPVITGLAAAWGSRRDPAIAFLLAWLLPSWLVFEAVPTKLPHYTLPLYPALFLLAASAWRATPPRWLARAAAGLCTLAAAAIGAGAVAAPLLLGASWWLGLPALCAAALVLWLALRRRLAAAILASCLLYAAVLQLELPALTHIWLAPRIVAALRQGAPEIPADGTGLVVAGYAEPSLMFLAGTHLDQLYSGASAARALKRFPFGAVVIAAPMVPEMQSASAKLGLTLAPAGAVEGVDTGRGKQLRLEIFRLVGRSAPQGGPG
jgi:4-amino-4-deoxy-L-arabinose transferase-like glycosyltransferase